MPKLEAIELERHRSQLIADVRALVEAYRAIFDWDVPDIDQRIADAMILDEIDQALKQIRKTLLGYSHAGPTPSVIEES